MKRKLLSIIYCIMFTCYTINTNAQANTELSNLVSPTKVNHSLLPNSDNVLNLGSANKSWKNLYLESSVYLHDLRFLSYGNNYSNLFVGIFAGPNTTGVANTAIGYSALTTNSAGAYNTATGYSALRYNSTGTNNTANGGGALQNNTTGGYNTANGFHALYSNATASYNTANGYDALFKNQSLNYIVAMGERSLYNLFSGPGRCTAVGSQAGYSNTSGGYNTYLGYHAGNTVTTGSSNTMLGYGTDVSSGGFTNTTALGNFAVTTASNQVRIGNSSVTSIGGYEPWTNLSDGRFKKNVKDNVPGLAFINQLHAITYTMDATSLRNFLGEDRHENRYR